MNPNMFLFSTFFLDEERDRGDKSGVAIPVGLHPTKKCSIHPTEKYSIQDAKFL